MDSSKIKIYPASNRESVDAKANTLIEENITKQITGIVDIPNFFNVKPSILIHAIDGVKYLQISSCSFFIQGYRFDLLSTESFSLTNLGVSNMTVDSSPYFIYLTAEIISNITLEDGSTTKQLNAIDEDGVFKGLSINVSTIKPVGEYDLILGVVCYSAQSTFYFIPMLETSKYSANHLLVDTTAFGNTSFDKSLYHPTSYFETWLSTPIGNDDTKKLIFNEGGIN